MKHSITFCLVLALTTVVLCEGVSPAEWYSHARHDHYGALGVDKSATTSEVKKAYRSLSKTLHPDRSSAPDAEETWAAVNAAYEVLKDEEKRGEYDSVISSLPASFRPKWQRPQIPLWATLSFTLALASIFHWAARTAAYKWYVGLIVRSKDYQARVEAFRAENGPDVPLPPITVDGGWAKPTWIDALPVKLVLWPWRAAVAIGSRVRIYWKYSWKKEELVEDSEDWHLVQRRRLGFSEYKYGHYLEAKRAHDEKMAKRERIFGKGAAKKHSKKFR